MKQIFFGVMLVLFVSGGILLFIQYQYPALFSQIPSPIKQAVLLERPVELSPEVLNRPDVLVRCEIQSEDLIATTYFKNGMVRATDYRTTLDGPVSEDAETTDALIRDGKTWIWNERTGEGQFFVVTHDNPEGYLDQLKDASSTCVTTTGEDTLFDIPTDITFVDFEEMVETEITDKIENALREGIRDALVQ